MKRLLNVTWSTWGLWKTLVKFLIAILLLAYLYHSGYFNVQQLGALLQPALIVTGIVTLGIVLVLASQRFQKLSRAPISDATAFQLTLVGVFFNYFIPGGVGGDLIKGAALKKITDMSVSQSAFVTIIDRLLGLVTMSTLSLLGFLFVPSHLKNSPRITILWWSLLCIWALFTITFFVLVSRRLSYHLVLKWLPQALWQNVPWLSHKIEWLRSTRRYPLKNIIVSSLFSFLSQISSIFVFFWIGKELYPELPLSWSIYFFVVPIGFILTAIPISPGGIGVGQAAFVFLFSRALNLKTDFGAISITGFQFYQLLWGLLGGYLFFFRKLR
ncbi:MAG: flippase-like domain-containing protein [Bdellovibrionaceae bacterium]|nr:flippase-like domain-containing protein [Pseudobdellovibrionaceae bacterium]MDW8190010.1 lysylphosphatidylglycerol synthase transmembrane domain-containing protein [Pseudobdellovibrionaceae bacterium]